MGCSRATPSTFRHVVLCCVTSPGALSKRMCFMLAMLRCCDDVFPEGTLPLPYGFSVSGRVLDFLNQRGCAETARWDSK